MIDFFGSGSYAKTADLEALRNLYNSELGNLKSEIVNLRNDLNLKATDSEEIAKNAANSAVEAESRVKGLESQFQSELAGLQQISIAAKTEVESITIECEKTKSSNEQLISSLENTKKIYDELLSVQSEVDSAKANIHSNIESINEALGKSETLPQVVENVEQVLEDSQELFSKIDALLSHSASRKNEIDELRDKIIGKDIEVDGSNTHIDGIKDKLEKSYSEIDSKIHELKDTTQALVDLIKLDYETQFSEQTRDFKNLVSKSTTRINEIDTELKNLLPGGMAAGLSAAYGKKKDDETASLISSEESFRIAIRNMIIISAIPFLVDVYLLFGEKVGIMKVLQDTPNLLLAILPLYLPALWIAISLNKKINLSKRLIEEYTHKEVLGKTFSGISNQIETLNANGSIKEELRTQLLFNLLQVSAENPGKLITDYNKSDHPLLSVIENSQKLSDSMESLSKIPGLSAITKKLAERAEKKLEETAKSVGKGIDLNDALESTPIAETEVEEKKD